MNNKIMLPKKDVLVVFFCVAFLGLCVAAIGATGRYRAKMLGCQLNQKKMANGSLMFANDNEGKLLSNGINGRHSLWMGPLAAYIDTDEVRYCPATAMNPNQPPLNQWLPSQLFGNARRTWVWNFDVEGLEYGSYAFNGWFYMGGSNPENFSNLSEVQQPAITPLFADSSWVDTWPRETDTCPADFDLNGTYSGAMMSRMLVNRHFDKNNISFADGHVGSVELRHLWSLNWHKQWTGIDNMTRVDGSPIYPE